MIDVTSAARGAVRPSRIRQILAGAAEVPELAARLPDRGWEVAIRVSGDRELRRLNRQFLADDHATDVLSFPTGEIAAGAHLGDIVLSWAACRRQGQEFGHGEESELLLLVVHAFLHLLGWDHATPAEEAEMSRLTLDALARSNVEISSGRLYVGTTGG